jgi:hypothetical protein
LISAYFCLYNFTDIALILTDSPEGLGWGEVQKNAFDSHRWKFPSATFASAVIPYNTTVCVDTINAFYNQGVRLILMPDFFPSCANSASLLHPDLYIVYDSISPVNTIFPNVSIFDVLPGTLVSRYVSGAFAAKQLKNNKVCVLMPGGFLSSTLWPNMIIQGMTHALNSNQWRLLVGYTGGFNDHIGTAMKVNALIARDCQVFITQQNSIFANQLVKNAGRFSIPFPNDVAKYIDIDDKHSVLVSNMLNPTRVQREIVTQFITTGAVTQSAYVMNFTNAFRFSEYAPIVKKTAINLLENLLEDLNSGALNPFCGALVQDSFGVNCVNLTFLTLNLLNGIEIV